MKKLQVLLIMIFILSCNTSSDNIEEIDTSETVTTTSNMTIKNNDDNNTTTTTEIQGYIFDNEKMSPFTGLELSPETWLKRPKRVLAFKIDNNINARPQSGIEEADSIHEILVEGGMTRFLAFFYDNSSEYLGPIRSARPTDPTLVRPYGGTLVVSGATAGLVPQIRELGVAVLEEQPAPSMFRIISRNAPHNLYADTELVRDVIDKKGFPFNSPPGPIYSFGIDQGNWSTGANRITVKYSEFTTIIWKLDINKYSRFIIDGYAKNLEPIAHTTINREEEIDIITSDTIVIIQGPIYVDEATTLPSVLTVGVGPVMIFNNGNYIEGTWRRNDIIDPFEFYDDDQNPIYVPPSKQWVHILPLDVGEVTWLSS